MLNKAQHKQRQSGIGSSDAAAAIGRDDYKSPLQLYHEKIESPERSWINERVHFGNLLEDVIANEYARRTGTKLRRSNKTHRHKKHDFMLAHPDRLIVGERKLLECKNVNEYYARTPHWGDEGTDEIPDVYLIQCHHQMIVMDYPQCDLAACVGGNRLKIFTIDYDEEFARVLIDKEREFWSYVESGKAPPPQTVSDLDMLYPVDINADLIITGNHALVENIQELTKAMLQRADIESVIAEHQKEIKMVMAGHSALRIERNDHLPSRLVATWRKAKDSTRFNEDKFKKDFPELHSMYVETKPGTRRFVVKREASRNKPLFIDSLQHLIGDDSND